MAVTSTPRARCLRDGGQPSGPRYTCTLNRRGCSWSLHIVGSRWEGERVYCLQCAGEEVVELLQAYTSQASSRLEQAGEPSG